MSHDNLGDILQGLIHENVVLPFDEKTKSIKIEEAENTDNKQLRSVKLTGISTFYFAFKLDDERHPFLGKLIQAKAKNIRKAVDAVLFCKVAGQATIFLIELKSNRVEQIAEKMKSSKAFIAFLTSFLSSYEKIDLSKFQIKSILFDRNVRKGKQPQTRINKDETFYHYGFKKLDNEVHVRVFIH